MDATTTITPGLHCNNACRFCEVAGLDIAQESSEDRVLAQLAAAPEVANGTVVFSGGEVTLNPSLLPWIRAAISGGARSVAVRTNGRMLAYQTFARELVESGVERVEVALHGPRAEIHDWHTRVEHSFAQSARGIGHLTRLGCVVGVNTVITRSNFRHLPDFVPLLARLSVRSWTLHELRPQGAGAVNRAKLAVPWAMVEPYLRRAAGNARRQRIALEVVRSDEESEVAA